MAAERSCGKVQGSGWLQERTREQGLLLEQRDFTNFPPECLGEGRKRIRNRGKDLNTASLTLDTLILLFNKERSG